MVNGTGERPGSAALLLFGLAGMAVCLILSLGALMWGAIGEIVFWVAVTVAVTWWLAGRLNVPDIDD